MQVQYIINHESVNKFNVQEDIVLLAVAALPVHVDEDQAGAAKHEQQHRETVAQCARNDVLVHNGYKYVIEVFK